MRTETITESKEAMITATPGEGAALEAAGRRLASNASWWGDVDSPEGDEHQRSLIRCRRIAGKKLGITVSGAVGVVAVGDLQVIVRPKIPIQHFIYLLNRSETLPRLDPSKGLAAVDASFWELIARWYLDQLQLVVRRDLIRDYREDEADLPIVRGRVVALPTARSYYRGKLQPRCRFEDYDADNALNRTLKHAARTVAASRPLPIDLRQRATWLLRPFDEVGEFWPEDMSIGLERRSGWYADALGLARSIIRGQGRGLEVGATGVWTFLFKTADLVEEGVRRVLTDGLPAVQVWKKGMQLTPSSLILTPDLRFGVDLAVGDVKYKLTGKDWNRSDLYQAVTFGTGFSCSNVAVIAFGGSSSQLPSVTVGDVRVVPFWWDCSAESTPEDSAATLCDQVESWLHQGLVQGALT